MTQRKVGWFSSGAASAIACHISKPDVLAYCETGAEHPDNARFRADCERLLFHQPVQILQSDKYTDTWDVWEKRQYLSGVRGAPCTGELKIKPRIAFSRPDDIHIFGYTADKSDIERAERMEEMWPDLELDFPLIEKEITKEACLMLLAKAGIAEPVTYAMGFKNANCLPCVKATSPDYWALIRKQAPEQFQRMVELSRRLKVRLTRLDGERRYIDEIPDDWPTTQPLVPTCDLFCQMVDMRKESHGN